MSESDLFERDAAERARLRVFNPTEGTIVTPDVVEIDTARERFNVVAQRLKNIAGSGIWLNPYKGVPRVSWMPDLDIVYLDEQCRVLRCIEGYRQSTMELPAIRAASAVILPTGRLSAARIQFGDQLELRNTATGARRAGRSEASEDDSGSLQTSEAEGDHEHRLLRRLFGSMFRRKREEPHWGPSDRRRGHRHVIPGSVAYFSIGTPRAQEVSNISTDGFYVRTEDRWTEGTSLLVGLQIVNPASHEVEAAISVQSKVVRTGPDGVGFVYDDEPVHRTPLFGATNPEEVVQLQRFMQRIQRG